MHNWHKPITIFLVFGLAGCGFKAPKADPVESEKVKLPSFSNSEQGSFALAAGPQAHNFSGNLLIWSQDVTAAGLRDVLDASVRTRKARAASLDMITQQWLPTKAQVALAQSRYQQVDKAYRTALTAGFRAETVRHDVTQPTAKNWYEKRMSELMQDTSSGDDWIKTHATEIKRSFAAYCDAKIWEFGLSKMATMLYAERPTPLGLCEDYYASEDLSTGKKAYFQNAGLCGAAATTNGKNYFGCLWQDGLLLTPQFKYFEGNTEETCVRGGVPGSKATTIATWASGSPSLIERIITDDVTRPKLASVVMLASSIPASTPDALGKLYPELKTCQLAFRRIDFDRTSRFEQASPGRLLAIGETDGISTQQYALDLIPRRIPADETKDAADYQRLTRLVRMFGWRVPTSDGYSVSVSDLLFNQPVGFDLSEQDPTQALQRNKDAIIPDDVAAADPAFRIFVEVKNQYVSSIYGQRTEALAALTTRENNLKIMDSELAKHDATDQELSVDGLHAVNAPHTLAYFHSFGLRLLRDGTRLSASLTIVRPITTCIDLESGAPCTGLAVGEDDIRDASLIFNKEANKLVFHVPLRDLADSGFAPAPRTAADFDKAQVEPLIGFNDIPESRLQGRDLEVIMYGNRLGELEFFTGDIFVLDPTTGEKVDIGSLNGDLFDETRRELLFSAGK